MASQYISELLWERRALCHELVHCITGLPSTSLDGLEGTGSSDSFSDLDIQNARTASDFCCGMLKEIHKQQDANHGMNGVYEHFMAIAEKVRTHGKYRKAERMVRLLAQVVPDPAIADKENATAKVLYLLHLLSHSPARDHLHKDATALLSHEDRKKREQFLAIGSKYVEFDGPLSPADESKSMVLSSAEASETDSYESDSVDSYNSAWSLGSRTIATESRHCTDSGSFATTTADLTIQEIIPQEDGFIFTEENLIKAQSHDNVKVIDKNTFNARLVSAQASQFLGESNVDLSMQLLRIDSSGESNVVHEAAVVRAVLLSLQGKTDPNLFIFDYELNRFVLNHSKRFSLAHTSPYALTHFLNKVCETMTDFRQIKAYCDRQLASSPCCLTEQNVMAALAAILQEYIDKIVQLEENILEIFSKNTATSFDKRKSLHRAVTLLQIESALGPFFTQLHLIRGVLDQIFPEFPNQDSRQRATMITDVLFEVALQEILTTSPRRKLLSVGSDRPLTKMFLSALLPQVRMIASLLAGNELTDPFEELFISVSFPASKDISSLENNSDDYHHDAPCLVADSRVWRPVAARILECVKAVRLVHHLTRRYSEESESPWQNTLSDPAGNGSPSGADIDILSDFQSYTPMVLETDSKDMINRLSSCGVSKYGSELLLDQPLFNSINRMYGRVNRLLMSHLQHNYSLVSRVEALQSAFFFQNHVLERFFLDLFHAVDRDSACMIEDEWLSSAMISYTEEYSTHFRVPSGYFLSQSHYANGNNSEAFRGSVEDKLTNILSADIEEDVNLCDLLFISLDSQRTYGANALDSLKLDFTMKPPLSVIVDQEAKSLYQRIFSLLLSIKRVVWALEKLQHILRRTTLCLRISVYKEGKNANIEKHLCDIHKVSVWSSGIAHFCRNLDSYLMRRIASKTWLLQTGEDMKGIGLKELRSLHYDFLCGLAKCCLLSPRQPKASNPIMEVLSPLLQNSIKFRDLAVGFLYALKNNEKKHADIVDIRLERILASLYETKKQIDTCKSFFLKLLTERSTAGDLPHLHEMLICLDFNENYSADKD